MVAEWLIDSGKLSEHDNESEAEDKYCDRIPANATNLPPCIKCYLEVRALRKRYDLLKKDVYNYEDRPLISWVEYRRKLNECLIETERLVHNICANFVEIKNFLMDDGKPEEVAWLTSNDTGEPTEDLEIIRDARALEILNMSRYVVSATYRFIL